MAGIAVTPDTTAAAAVLGFKNSFYPGLGFPGYKITAEAGRFTLPLANAMHWVATIYFVLKCSKVYTCHPEKNFARAAK